MNLRPSNCCQLRFFELQLVVVNQSTPATKSTTILIAATTISAAMRTMTVDLISLTNLKKGRTWVSYQSIPRFHHVSYFPALSVQRASLSLLV